MTKHASERQLRDAYGERGGGPFTPSVDIIVPTNRGATAFLKAAVRSVQAQTYRHWTLTIVDDGGPDPEDLDRTFSDIPAVQVVHQEAAGTSLARNRGIEETNSPLVAFLDDDDLWFPERLEHQVRALARTPDYIGTYCGGAYIDAEDRPFGDPWPALQASSRAFLAGDQPIPRIVTMMVRREAVEAVGGFDPAYITGQDLDFTLRLLQIGEMSALNETLVRYRRHGSNVSQPESFASRDARTLMLKRQARAAEDRQDHAAAVLLRENYRRQRQQMAREAVRTGVGALRSGNLESLRREVRWVVAAPLPAALELGARVRGYLRGGRR